MYDSNLGETTNVIYLYNAYYYEMKRANMRSCSLRESSRGRSSLFSNYETGWVSSNMFYCFS